MMWSSISGGNRWGFDIAVSSEVADSGASSSTWTLRSILYFKAPSSHIWAQLTVSRPGSVGSMLFLLQSLLAKSAFALLNLPTISHSSAPALSPTQRAKFTPAYTPNILCIAATLFYHIQGKCKHANTGGLADATVSPVPWIMCGLLWYIHAGSGYVSKGQPPALRLLRAEGP